MWVSKGLLEDLARFATKGEKNYELLGVVTETEAARDFLTSGDVDIVIVGHGRFEEWSQMWREGVFVNTPQFCAMLISTVPVSTATLMEASEVGIFEVADLTMDRDAIGQRMVDLFAQLRRDIPMQNGILDSHAERYQLLSDISDDTDRKILQLIAQGKFDKEISKELFLSLQTIRNRVSRMLTESGARNRTHLAVLFTTEKARNCPQGNESQNPEESGNHDQVA
jgi:DNA-binding NarL/FixJ family response regulator